MRRFSMYAVLCLMLLFSIGSLFAAGETIYEIRVEGAKTVADELITSTISLRTGGILDPAEVAKSIKQLYKMSIFSDIRVLTEPYKTGVNLIIRVQENPVLASIEYPGMKVVKKDRLDELMTVRVGTFWSENQKQQLVSKLANE